MYSNPALIRLRSTLRSLGILRFVQASPVYGWISRGYESRFDTAMMACLQPGMRVFDIGANVGYYTQKFAEAVGPTGEVHAFEPVPASAAKVRELQAQYPWIHVHECAVAEKSGEVLMNADCDSTLPTNRIASITDNDVMPDSFMVPSVSIDDVIGRHGVPSFVKIDVEGYELNVIHGSLAVLKMNQLQHVFIEIHFALLESLGFINAGDLICRVLKEHGFRCAFTDFSHLNATRR